MKCQNISNAIQSSPICCPTATNVEMPSTTILLKFTGSYNDLMVNGMVVVATYSKV